jgi:alpha-L-rhamnosidase
VPPEQFDAGDDFYSRQSKFELINLTNCGENKPPINTPVPGGTFTQAKATFESPYGTVASAWEAADGALASYAFTVPANTSATLYLPVDEDKASAATLPEDIEYLGMAERNARECASFKAPAGSFELTF